MKLPATKKLWLFREKMTDLSPLVFLVKTLFLVSLKIGHVENEAILHTYIKNTYSTKTTYKNKEMYFIYESSSLYKKSLKAQLITHYLSHWLNEVNHGQTMRFWVVFVLWVISKNVKVPRYICFKFKTLHIQIFFHKFQYCIWAILWYKNPLFSAFVQLAYVILT